MVRCSVLGCKSCSESKIVGLSFHSFPNDPSLCNMWIMATGRLNWTPTKYSRICGDHFANNFIIKKGKKTLLYPNAIPKVLPNDMANDNKSTTIIETQTEYVKEKGFDRNKSILSQSQYVDVGNCVPGGSSDTKESFEIPDINQIRVYSEHNYTRIIDIDDVLSRCSEETLDAFERYDTDMSSDDEEQIRIDQIESNLQNFTKLCNSHTQLVKIEPIESNFDSINTEYFAQETTLSSPLDDPISTKTEPNDSDYQQNDTEFNDFHTKDIKDENTEFNDFDTKDIKDENETREDDLPLYSSSMNQIIETHHPLEENILDSKDFKEFAEKIEPERKRKRIQSPPIIHCILVPVTSLAPSPRVPQSWEVEETAPRARKSQLMPCQLIKEEVETAENVETESIGSTPRDTPSISTESLIPGPKTSIVDALADDGESDVLNTAGSDVDEGSPEAAEDVVTDSRRLSFLDAQSDCAIQRILTGKDLIFDWRSDSSSFKGERETFTGTPGPTFSMSDVESPLDIFEKFFDEDLITLIVDETNRYAQSLLASNELKAHARLQLWQPVSREELWVFLAILMWQGLHPLPVELEYWHPPLPFFSKSHLESLMTYNRFLLLKKCLHFADNSQMDQNATQERKRLYKIQPVLDHLNRKYSELYYPQREIALDESLLLWKGKLTFAQKKSNKTAEVGLKTFELCESKTGYLYNFLIYTGKSDSRAAERGDMAAPEAQDYPEGATGKIVFDLVRPLFHKGHTLVMDNFYNSPLLSRALKRNGTDTMGTLRLNRQFVPDSLKQLDKMDMRVGEVAFSHTKDLSITVWSDANLVSLISTYHKCEVGGKEKCGQYKNRPQVALDYNLAMGGVDKKDQLLSAFPMERSRNLIWYKKLFRRLLNVTILNSHILFNHRKKISNRDFRLKLVDSIIRKYKTPLPQLPRETNTAIIRKAGNEQHYLERGESNKVRCRCCSKHKIDRRTTWRCDTCKVPLCVEFCFKHFHTH